MAQPTYVRVAQGKAAARFDEYDQLTSHSAPRTIRNSNYPEFFVWIAQNLTVHRNRLLLYLADPRNTDEQLHKGLSMAEWKRKTFASLRLDNTHREDFRKWVAEGHDNPLIVLQDLLAWGYKVSLTNSEKTNSYIVTVIGTEYATVNQESMLTTHAGSIGEALLLSGYKVFGICASGVWPTEDDTAAWG